MLQYSAADIDHAFKLGALMFGVSVVTIRTDLGATNNDKINVKVIDTFGNSILLEFNWTGKESESGGEMQLIIGVGPFKRPLYNVSGKKL